MGHAACDTVEGLGPEQFLAISGIGGHERRDQPKRDQGKASRKREARAFAETQGYAVDWDAVTRLDDESLINGVCQIAPFDLAAKQALVEADTIGERCELLVQLMQFFGRRDRDDGRVTLQ